MRSFIDWSAPSTQQTAHLVFIYLLGIQGLPLREGFLSAKTWFVGSIGPKVGLSSLPAHVLAVVAGWGRQIRHLAGCRGGENIMAVGRL